MELIVELSISFWIRFCHSGHRAKFDHIKQVDIEVVSPEAISDIQTVWKTSE